MRRPLVALVTLGLVAVASGCGSGSHPTAASTRSTPTTPAQQARHAALPGSQAPDFVLRDQHGSVVRLSTLRGKVVLLTFLYTSCPDVCPLIATQLNLALRALQPAQRSDVRVVAVSVDPAHDTRASVRRFIATHHLLPQFHYLTGTAAELKPVWQNYNLLVESKNVERVAHSAFVLLLDRRGKPRLYYSSQVTSGVVLRDVRRLLRSH